jgi:FAD/FMN-containing dehydrogenase/Fe-S oxidoreductase
MKEQLAYFKSIFEGEFYFSKLHQYLYATDASVYRKLPLAVAFPKNSNAIKQLIDFATKHHTSLVPRAAGTSLAGQCVGDGIIVDVSTYFTEIISVDKENKTIRLQPGVIRDELNNYLKPYGLFFGPNTSTSNRCMIGGMVGNNSSGTTSIQYGVTRDKVLALKTILSNGDEVTFTSLNNKTFEEKKKLNSLEGTIYKSIYNELKSKEAQLEIINNFPKSEIHRRNTGYAVDELIKTQVFSDSEKPINFASLLCGSEGTLAFTTEITLQLDNLPPQHTAMVVSHYSSLESCLNDVSTVMMHNLHTCEMMDDIILDCTKKNAIYNEYRKFVQGNPKALLLLELKAAKKNDLEKQVDELLISLKSSKLSYAYPTLKGDEVNNALELRKAGLGLLGNMVGDHKAVACIEDTAVSLTDLPNYIREFTALMKKFDQKAVYYAHAGAGELHLRPILNLKEKEGVHYFREITTEVAKLVKKYRGSFSGEHGDGIVRGEFLPLMIGAKNYEVLKRIKNVFDPNNIFNPGKIIDAFPMDKSLRYKEERNEPVIDTLIDFKDSEGILRMAEKCNGSGDCRKTENSNGVMCPSYQATKNELHTTRGRANVLREVLTNNDSLNKFDSQELKEAFDLCLSCKACGSECPSNVDIATAKAEFLYQYYTSNKRKFSDILFGKSSYYNSIAAKFPRLSNAVFTNKMTGAIIKNISGIATKRSLPIISSKPFNRISQNTVYQNDTFIKEVVLFVDEFSNFLDAPIARDTHYLLKKLNYKVIIIDHLDSARALLSKGFLKEAQSIINNNIAYLNENISASIPIIGIEPSAILGFRDEYIRLAKDKKTASAISKQCFIIEEFLASEIELGHIKSSQFSSDKKVIKIHNHCHQKALSNQKVTFDILNLPLNYKPTIIPSGCCGMAGSFGFEKDTYEVSMQIGELKLFPAIRNTPNDSIIAANGTSCRHQIKDGTQREAFHPISILKNALS